MPIDKRTQHPLPCRTVGAKAAHRGGRLAREEPDAAIIQRMSERQGRSHPLQTVLLEFQTTEDWRHDSDRVNGRADIVREPGPGQKFRAAAAANLVAPLEDDDGEPGEAEDGGRGEAVRSRADNCDVVAGLVHARRRSGRHGHTTVCRQRPASTITRPHADRTGTSPSRVGERRGGVIDGAGCTSRAAADRQQRSTFGIQRHVGV